MGTWRALKAEFTHEADDEATIRSFSEIYLTEYLPGPQPPPGFQGRNAAEHRKDSR